MQGIVAFFQDNGPWIFGSGGAIVAVLAVLKLAGGRKETPRSGSIRIEAGDNAEITTGPKTSGLDGAWVALIVVALACLAGFVSTVGGDRITVNGDDGVIINDSDGNVVNN